MLDFPPSPAVDDVYPDPPVTGQPAWRWDGTAWVRMPGVPVPVWIDDAPPPDPRDGDLWFDTVGLLLYVSYFDGTSQQWVPAYPSGRGEVGPQGPQGMQGEQGPAGEGWAEAPQDGQTWGRRNANWSRAVPVVDELDGFAAQTAALPPPFLVLPRDATADLNSPYLLFNAFSDGGAWRYVNNGFAAMVYIDNGDGLLKIRTAPFGTAKAAFTWGNIRSFGSDGGMTASGPVSTSGMITSTANPWALLATNGAVIAQNVGFFAQGCGYNSDLVGVDCFTAANADIFCRSIRFATMDGRFALHHALGGVVHMVIDGTIWQQISFVSDERLKDDVEPARFDCLGLIEKVPLFSFRWRHDGKREPIGFVAQRLKEIAPSLVLEPPPQAPPDNPLQIDTNNVLATLVGAVQQLTERVKTLEAAVAAR